LPQQPPHGGNQGDNNRRKPRVFIPTAPPLVTAEFPAILPIAEFRLAALYSRPFAASTVDNEAGFIRRALRDLPERPDTAAILALQNALCAEGKSPGTVNRYIDYLRGVYEYARKRGAAVNDPTADVERLKIKTVPMPPLKGRPAEVFARALSICADLRERVYLGLCYFRGLRRSEGLGLLAGDFDPEHGTLAVVRQRLPKERAAQPMKTNKKERIISLPAALARDLRALVKQGPMMRRFGNQHATPEASPFLFAWNADQLEKFSDRVRAVCPELKEGRPWHQWREAFCVAGAEVFRGDNAKLRAITGHASEVSLSTYLRSKHGIFLAASDTAALDARLALTVSPEVAAFPDAPAAVAPDIARRQEKLSARRAATLEKDLAEAAASPSRVEFEEKSDPTLSRGRLLRNGATLRVAIRT
jgi:integrase